MAALPLGGAQTTQAGNYAKLARERGLTEGLSGPEGARVQVTSSIVLQRAIAEIELARNEAFSRMSSWVTADSDELTLWVELPDGPDPDDAFVWQAATYERVNSSAGDELGQVAYSDVELWY